MASPKRRKTSERESFEGGYAVLEPMSAVLTAALQRQYPGGVFAAGDVVTHIEVAENLRRQGRAHSYLRSVEKVFVRVGLQDEIALRLMRSAALPPVLVYAEKGSGQFNVLFCAGTVPMEIGAVLEDVRASISLLCASALAKLPVKHIALVFHCIEAFLTANPDARMKDADLRLKSADAFFDRGDMDRLSIYISPGSNVAMVADLWPTIGHLAMRNVCLSDGKIDPLTLTPFQKAALIGVALQHKQFSTVAAEYQLPADQLKIHFKLALKRVRAYLLSLSTASVEREIRERIGEAAQDVMAGLERGPLAFEDIS